jgi:FkbM family methyltransferase
MRSSTAKNIIRSLTTIQVRAGRSKLRKFLNRLITDRQVVADLEPGLKLGLDLDKGLQNFFFWFPEEYEPALQWSISNLLPLGGTFMDCGSNTGLFGLYAVHRRMARSYFIEPHPRLAREIRANIERNGFGDRSVLHEVAASAQPGVMKLMMYEGQQRMSDGVHRLVKDAPTGDGGEKIVEVKVRTLKELMLENGLEHLDFLKVDVEGHDVEALEGLADYLDPKRVACIYVESAETFDLVRSHGYIPFQTRKIYIDELLRFQKQHNGVRYFEPAQSGSENILWVAPGSLHEQLLNHHVRAWQSLER